MIKKKLSCFHITGKYLGKDWVPLFNNIQIVIISNRVMRQITLETQQKLHEKNKKK